MSKMRRRARQKRQAKVANTAPGAGGATHSRTSAPADHRSRTRLILGSILLLGLALRISYLREIVHNPDFDCPLVDAAYHDYWARALASGDWSIPENVSYSDDPEIRTTPYFRPPGYPFFLAAVYRMFQGSYLAARIVQMAFGLAGGLLAYLLGKSVFDRRTGLVFAALTSTYWAFIYFEGELLSTALLGTLGLAVVYVLCLWHGKRALRYALAGGILFGIFAVVRPNILPFGPAVLLWCWWVHRRREPKSHVGLTWLGFSLGAMAIILPVTIRNYVVAHDVVLITSNLGINLYTGNSENSTGKYTVFPSVGTLTEQTDWNCFHYPQIVRGVEALHGREMKHSEVSSYFTGKALDYIRTHKARTLKLALIKTLLFWGPTELPSNKEIYLEKLNSGTLRYLPGFPLVLSLGLLGLAQLGLGCRKGQASQGGDVEVSDRQFERSVLALLFVLTYFLSVLPFFIVGRYRVPVIPFLLLFAAYALGHIGQWIAARDRKRSLIWAGAAVATYIIASVPIIPHEHDQASAHLLRASCYRLSGQIDLAVQECRKAVQLNPAEEKGHRRLADLLMRQKQYPEAIEQYTQARRLGPPRFDMECNLALAYRSLGALDRAIAHLQVAIRLKPEVPEVRYRLGTLLKRTQQFEGAIEQFRQAAALAPDYLPAHRDLATTLLTQGRFDEAIAQLRQILTHYPNEPNLHNLLGIALKSAGDLDGAITHYRRALELKPSHYQAHNNLANALLVQGHITEALAHYQQALQIRPDYDEAKRNMEAVLRSRPPAR
ncbi:MAG: tetratricopeptide repeat protein [Phycisphaerales bacterium]|nr:MAG: tetratricopeptide repeat protein [Phycisphaerales bacterium]